MHRAHSAPQAKLSTVAAVEPSPDAVANQRHEADVAQLVDVEQAGSADDKAAAVQKRLAHSKRKLDDSHGGGMSKWFLDVILPFVVPLHDCMRLAASHVHRRDHA